MQSSVKQATKEPNVFPEAPGYRNTESSSASNSPALPESKFDKYKRFLLWWNTEEWWSCWIGLIFFGCITAAVHHGIPQPEFLKWETNPFHSFNTVGNYGLIVLFFAMGAMLWLAMGATQTPHWRFYGTGYAVVFCVALLSKILASNVTLHKASIGDSIWAIVLGCVIRNMIGIFRPTLPPWLKVSQQTELYIAISLVLLCIDISVLRPLAPRAIFVSWLDTPTLFIVVAMIGWRWMGIDRQTSIIMSGATFICGSSAAIALGASMGVPYKTEMPIAIISVFTIPSIIVLPYIAKNLGLSPSVSGAWFGGCVDSTGAVIASASIYGDKEAINTSAVVKMVQNVLIGPLSVIVAWAWSRYELQTANSLNEELLRNAGDEDIELHDIPGRSRHHPRRTESVHVLLWKRFPKFVLGFIITAILFNTVVSTDPEIRLNVNDFCFYVSEWFSTLSFVSIGLGLHFNELKDNIRSLGKLCSLYLLAQIVDIVATAGLAYTAFTYL